MANKRYNTKTFDFVVNGEHVYFTCDTTNTKNGFCHHVFASGGGKYYEHSRVSYLNCSNGETGYSRIGKRLYQEVDETKPNKAA